MIYELSRLRYHVDCDLFLNQCYLISFSMQRDKESLSKLEKMRSNEKNPLVVNGKSKERVFEDVKLEKQRWSPMTSSFS